MTGERLAEGLEVGDALLVPAASQHEPVVGHHLGGHLGDEPALADALLAAHQDQAARPARGERELLAQPGELGVALEDGAGPEALQVGGQRRLPHLDRLLAGQSERCGAGDEDRHRGEPVEQVGSPRGPARRRACRP